MDRKIVLTTLAVSLLILILAAVMVFSWDKKNRQLEGEVKIPPKEAIVYYYGETCSHCQEVQKWMSEEKIEEKIKIEKKEVWNNQKNSLELTKVAEFCRLNSSSIGVPFLFADGQCFIGVPEVKRVLTEKLTANK